MLHFCRYLFLLNIDLYYFFLFSFIWDIYWEEQEEASYPTTLKPEDSIALFHIYLTHCVDTLIQRVKH